MKSAILTSLILMLAITAAVNAVEVTVGFEELTLPAGVDTPLLGNATESAETVPAKLPELPTANVPENPSADSLEKHPHLRQPATAAGSDKPAQADFPTTTGTQEVSSVVQKGKGSSSYQAYASGETELQVFLWTYRPAKIIARLFDANGDEIYFMGKSLLYWERPDDKAWAPVIFKGVEDITSMKKIDSNNFDAVQNTYKFNIESGQRLTLEISGDPEASSYAEAKGPLEAEE
ncbi:MAG: hypothetical protein ACD_39C01002G0003 [uncultured bacterium]|nr:MAG: hypothetical protein ACD_39C01002G0003 [uncultured bacterium]